MKSMARVTLLVCLSFGCGGCMAHARSYSVESSAHSVVKTLMTETLPEGSGREVRMLTVEYPPGVRTPAHRHPGAVFVYVLEGAVLCGLDEGPVRTYRQGESWWERPGQVHRVSENASQTERAKLLVFFVTETGKPVLETVRAR